jgi:hypothetical protein
MTVPRRRRRRSHWRRLASGSRRVLVAATRVASRWRDVCGWFGIATGAAMFVTALVVPLDDPALVVALMLAVRGGRTILGTPVNS